MSKQKLWRHLANVLNSVASKWQLPARAPELLTSETDLKRLILFAAFTSLFISGCGVQKMGDDIGNALNKSLGCAFSTALDFAPQRITIQIPQAEFNTLQAMIVKFSTASANSFWSALSANEDARLEGLIATAYNSSDANSSVRDQQPVFYRILFARGMIHWAQTRDDAKTLSYVQVVTKNENGKQVLHNYGINIEIPDSTSTAKEPNKSFTFCD